MRKLLFVLLTNAPEHFLKTVQNRLHRLLFTKHTFWKSHLSSTNMIQVVVVVMMSPSGTAYMGGQNVLKRWGIPPDSESGWIRLSLVIVYSHSNNWGTTWGRLSLPTADVLSTIVKQSTLTDVDKLSSCSLFSNSVVGFTGQKTQPTTSKYWRNMTQVWNIKPT